jgi:D-alanyl-D-alanine carboxypeptidase (penicillin-binding protein 5/6)
MSVNRILIILLLWLLPGISTGETYEVDSDADFFILGDITNDTIIAEKNVNVSLSTGDLTRLMALYVVFSALDQGRIHLDEYVEISRAAAQTPGARMFLVDGQRIQIKNLIESVASYGAMDAMIALVEATSESESDEQNDETTRT